MKLRSSAFTRLEPLSCRFEEIGGIGVDGFAAAAADALNLDESELAFIKVGCGVLASSSASSSGCVASPNGSANGSYSSAGGACPRLEDC